MARGPEPRQVDPARAWELYQGHTLAEAARMLGVSTSTLWRRLRGARRTLRKPGHQPTRKAG